MGCGIIGGFPDNPKIYDAWQGMSKMTKPPEIPEMLTARFVDTFESLVGTVRKALNRAPEGNQAARWRTKALPLLDRDFAALQDAFARHSTEDPQPLRDRALSACSLARDMDGFALDCFDPEDAKQIEDDRRMVVLAAWQVCHAQNAS
jgi:hypothetical protein